MTQLQLVASLGMAVARTDRDGLVVVAAGEQGMLEVWRERAPPGRGLFTGP